MADNNSQIMEELNNSINDLNNTIKVLNVNMLGSASNSLASGVKNLSEKVKKSEEGFNSFGQAINRSSDQIKKSFGEITGVATTFGRALVDTSNNFSKFGRSVTEASQAIESFGVLGKTIGFALKPFTMFTDAILGSTDAIFDAKDDLAKIGAVGRLTFNDISKLGTESGFATSQLKEYTKVVKSLGSFTVSLGNNVSEGITQFSKLTAVTDKQRAQFIKLGVGVEELAQHQADYLVLQAQAGIDLRKEVKDRESLRRASLAYTENLLVLSAVSGKSVQQVKEAQQEQIRQTNFQIKIAQLNQKAREAETEEEAKNYRNQADMLTKGMQQVAGLGNRALADAAREVLTTGTLIGKNAQMMARMGLTENLQEWAEAVSSGGDATKEAAKLQDAYNEKYGSTIQTLGGAASLSQSVAELFGLVPESLEKYNREVNKSIQNVVNNEAARVKAQKESDDNAEVARTATIQAMIDTRKAFDEVVGKLREKVLPLIPDLANSVSQLLEKVKQFVTYLEGDGISGIKRWATDQFPKLMTFMDTLFTNLDKVALTAGGLLALMKLRESTVKTLGTVGNPMIVDAPGGLCCPDQSMGPEKGPGPRRRRRGPRGPRGKVGPVTMPQPAGPSRLSTALNAAKNVRGVGPAAAIVGLGMMATDIKDIKEQESAGQLTPEEASKQIKATIGTGVGGAGGAWAGAAAGAAIGSVVPVVGTVLGGLIGGAIGAWGGAALGKRAGEAFDNIFGDTVKDASQTMGQIGTTAPGAENTPAGRAMAAGMPAGMAAPAAGYTNESLREMGLRIKRGDVQKPGAVIDPKTIEMAKRVQAILGPELAYFSGFNDVFHQENAPKSMHTQGRAFDFVLSSPPTPERSRQIQSFLRTSGAVNVIDEYANPSSRSTGGHFHVQTLAKGGIANGPITGFPAELHGRELVTPISPNSLLEKMATTSVSNNNEVVKAITNTVGMDSGSKVAEVQIRMMDMISDKLDNMIGKLSESNDIQEKLLQYTRA